MNKFASPFLSQIKECKTSMRKLRKKIYKHSLSLKNKYKKNRDGTEEILDILRLRDVPDFVTESLRKRRNFDISSIKNILVNVNVSVEEIMNRADCQQSEIKKIYADHKDRMREIKRKQMSKAQKPLNFPPLGIYSSTQEQYNVDSSKIIYKIEQFDHSCQNNESFDSISNGYYDSLSKRSKEGLFSENYLNMHNMESSINSEMALFQF